MNEESKSDAPSEGPTSPRAGARGPGLPSGPRGGAFPAMRKPPSLSTLAMPSFSGMRPPSKNLLKALTSLISRLPRENRDLIRTVTELIKATAKESKDTKMPLSNLLLVFCPSLNMSPPLLRVLCEGEGLWGDVMEDSPVIDIKRESVIIDIKGPSSIPKSDSSRDGDDDDEYSDASDSLDHREPEDHENDDSVRRPERDTVRGPVSTVYLDSESVCDTSSVSDGHMGNKGCSGDAESLNTMSSQDDASYVSTSEGNSLTRPDAPSPALSSSAESLATPTTSSGGPSFSDLALQDPYSKTQPTGAPEIAESTPYPLQPTRPKLTISNPIPITGPIQFPTSADSTAPTAMVLKRKSIPTLSLPNLSENTTDIPPSPISPASTTASTTTSSLRGKRLKRPSLRLLFSKRSTSSLTSNSKDLISAPSPYLQTPHSASDSSVSTPISAVTAPQSSTYTLPPQLDTPIESQPLNMGLGIEIEDVDTPRGRQSQEGGGVADVPETITLAQLGETPIADKYRGPGGIASASHLRPQVARSRLTSTTSNASSSHLSLLGEDEPEEDWTQSVLLAADMDLGWGTQLGRRS